MYADPERVKFAVHACWLDKDCRAVPCPAHTYFTLFGWVWRINPPVSQYYLRRRPNGELYFGWGATWQVLQFIGPSLPKIKTTTKKKDE